MGDIINWNSERQKRGLAPIESIPLSQGRAPSHEAKEAKPTVPTQLERDLQQLSMKKYICGIIMRPETQITHAEIRDSILVVSYKDLGEEDET